MFRSFQPIQLGCEIQEFLYEKKELTSGETGKKDQEVNPTLPPQYPSKIPFFNEKFSSKSGLPNDNELGSKADYVNPVQTIAITGDYSEILSQLDAQILSTMEISQNLVLGGTHKAHTCKVCGKEGMKNTLREIFKN